MSKYKKIAQHLDKIGVCCTKGGDIYLDVE